MKKPAKSPKYVKVKNTGISPTDADTHVGYVAMEFNNLELQLFYLLQTVSGMGNWGATAIWSLGMYQQRLQAVNLFFDKRSVLKPYRAQWRKLRKFLVDVGEDRNSVVHGERLAETLRNGKAKHYITQNNLFDPFNMARKNYKFDIAELREIILDIRAGVEGVQELQNNISQSRPIPEQKFEEFQVRRRPKRVE